MYKNFTIQARTGRGISRDTLDHILRANNNNYLQQVSETISLFVGCIVTDQIGTSWLTRPIRIREHILFLEEEHRLGIRATNLDCFDADNGFKFLL
jgi:hypothetical protein